VKQLYLYTTSGCHLCEKAEEILVALASEGVLEWQAVEISDSDELVERYGIRIPVIRPVNDTSELGWPFDREDLRNWLGAL